MKTIETARAAIKKYAMLKKRDKVIVGISGGADSVCLLHVLLGLKEYCLELAAVHVNHGIRGAEADVDEAFTAELCERLGVPLDVYRYNVPEEARRLRLTQEEAGRVLRYKSFEQSRIARGADKIAVAHNKNDNAETVLMRIFRGTGLKGLSGIPAVRGDIIRPLIDTSRAEIESFCRENNISYRTDSTNLKNIYTRNIIRLELLPLVEKKLAPEALRSVSRMSEIVAEEDCFLDGQAMEVLKESRTGEGGLSIEVLNKYPDVLKRRALRLFFSEYANRDISYEHVSMALELLRNQTGKSLCLPFGIRLERRYGEVVIAGERGFGDFCYELPLDTRVFIAEAGMYVSVSMKKTEFNFDNVCTKTFSCDKMVGALFVRNRRPGDKIFVASMGGNKKLKDYFIDAKIPRSRRDSIPVLTCGGDVVWIMDEKNIISDRYKAKDAEQKKIYVHKMEARENEGSN